MGDLIHKAHLASVARELKTRPVDVDLRTHMSDAQYKKEVLAHVNPDKDKENESIIIDALNRAFKKPGWLAGFTKHVMEEIGTDPTPKNRKYVHSVIVSYIDELLDMAV